MLGGLDTGWFVSLEQSCAHSLVDNCHGGVHYLCPAVSWRPPSGITMNWPYYYPMRGPWHQNFPLGYKYSFISDMYLKLFLTLIGHFIDFWGFLLWETCSYVFLVLSHNNNYGSDLRRCRRPSWFNVCILSQLKVTPSTTVQILTDPRFGKHTPQPIKPLDFIHILLVGFPCQHKLLINGTVSVLTATGCSMQRLWTMTLRRGWKALHNVYNKVWRVAWQRNVHNGTALWRCSFCPCRPERPPIVLVWFSFLGLLTRVKQGPSTTNPPALSTGSAKWLFQKKREREKTSKRTSRVKRCARPHVGVM